MVMSPGVPTDLPIVLRMKEEGIPVWGEIELAYVCGKGEILGITGTNGKTTTTSLLGEIMKNAFESVLSGILAILIRRLRTKRGRIQ